MAGNATRGAHLIQELMWMVVCIKKWRGIHDNIYLSAFLHGLGCHQAKNHHFDPGLEGHVAKSLHFHMDFERHDALKFAFSALQTIRTSSINRLNRHK